MHSLNPDLVLFVGDLGIGDLRIVKAINNISIPSAVVLGNHDRGADLSGHQIKKQLSVLGDRNCSWRLREWENLLVSVVGARPCSAGGGYYLSPQMKAAFGHVTLEESVKRIVNAASVASSDLPLIILAHSGPTGLGSEASSICGRDWKSPSIDWGDKDLEISITEIQKLRKIDLVVFGHMHHALKRGKGIRQTFYIDKKKGTAYINAACVPRRGVDESGNELCHFSWVEFSNLKLIHASHRWYKKDASIAFKEILYDES